MAIRRSAIQDCFDDPMQSAISGVTAAVQHGASLWLKKISRATSGGGGPGTYPVDSTPGRIPISKIECESAKL